MVHKTEKIRLRVIAPVFVALLVLGSIAVWIIHQSQFERTLGDATLKTRQAHELLQHYIHEEEAILGSLNSDLRRDSALQYVWLAKDRQKLKQHVLPRFQEIREKLGVTHLYFIGLDKKCFLRVHNPSLHGDTINRFTLQKASETGEAGTGIELGPLGTLTLRVVYPWKIKGKHVGYIEVGQGLNHVIEEISELLKVDVLVAIKKKFLQQSLWQQGMTMPRQDDIRHGENSLIVITDTLNSRASPNRDIYLEYIKQHDHIDYKPITYTAHGEQYDFSAGFVPLIDAGGRDVGDMFVVSDIRPEMAALKKFTIILILSAVIITLVIFVLFYRYIGGIERRLQISRKKLITESKAREKSLLHARDVAEETNRMKSQFLANMSHEIRTPMNGVMGMLQLLNDTALTEGQQECTEVALKSSEILVTLLNDILDLSKIESGKLTVEEIPFDVRMTLEDVTGSLYEQASKKGLELYCLINANIPMQVVGDPCRLRQILNNLISNAVKFTKQGKILVRLDGSVNSDGQNMLLFEVSDTGIGIPEEVHSSIFKSFVQADGSTTRIYGGTGLGLTISKKLIGQMGGEIKVKSTPDSGSTFSFTLPMKQADGNESEEMPFQKISGQRVLLLNSTPEMEEVMSSLGLEVERVGEDSVSLTGYENIVLDKLRSARLAGDVFSIVVMEKNGGGDVFSIAEAVRADTENADTRLVLLTALGHRGDGDAARRAGFDSFLTKPVRQAVLYDCIATILGFEDHDRKVMVTSHSLKEQHSHEKRHVLLAEDDEVSQMVICAMLKKLGYRVDVVANGSEALEALKNKSYQLILMDCQMPEMDGYEATKAIRNSNEEWKGIPIVALTANALAGDREKCIAAGMDEYMTKPVEQKTLEMLLLRVLDGTSLDYKITNS